MELCPFVHCSRTVPKQGIYYKSWGVFILLQQNYNDLYHLLHCKYVIEEVECKICVLIASKKRNIVRSYIDGKE